MATVELRERKSDKTSAHGGFETLQGVLCGLLRRAENPEHPASTSCAPWSNGGPLIAPLPPAEYELDTVAHLSTSGFITPLIFARDWLQRQPGLDDSDRSRLERFWNQLKGAVRFRLSHDPVTTQREGPPFELRFDYGDPNTSAGAASSLPPGGPSAYPPDQPLEVPNDVFVMRKLDRQDVATTLRDLVREWVGPAPEPGLPDPPERNGYKAAYLPSSSQERFRDRVLTLFGYRENGSALVPSDSNPDPLRDLYNQWYVANDMTFTVDEALDFLRKDRAVSEQDSMALVLPGGGVKATYQAVLLDDLYGRGKLVNKRGAGPATFADGALHVKAVIGTSGGALMGLFTSLQRPTQPAPETTDRLAGLWVRNGKVTAKDSRVFPWLAVPRYVSLWVVLLIIAIVFFVGSKTRSANSATTATPGGSPASIATADYVGWWPTTLMLLTLVGTPILIKLAIECGAHEQRFATSDPLSLESYVRSIHEYLPVLEGLIYTAMLIAAHYVWTCGQHSLGSLSTRARRTSRLRVTAGWAVGALVAVMFTGMAARHPPTLRMIGLMKWNVWTPSLFIALGGALSLPTVIAEGLRANGRSEYYLSRHGDYFCGLTGLLGTILIAISLFGFGVAFGLYTYLELTLLYWVFLACGAAMAGGLSLLVSRRLRGGRDRNAVTRAVSRSLEFLQKNQPFMRIFRSSPIWTLTFVMLGGLVLWVGFVAPALYSNTKAVALLQEEVVEAGYDPAHLDLQTNFVVTASNLLRVGSDRSLLMPDYYFCFGGECPPERPGVYSLPRWTFGFEQLRDPVFASGSPFPIFPGHLVSQPCVLTLVDGGFAHNTPVEAAHLVHARQVLIVNSSPLEDTPEELKREAKDSHIASDFVRNLERLPGFLFDRSQETDRLASREMVIIALTPHYPDPPFLGDFRAKTVMRLRDAAKGDLQKERIGTIVSVGVPPAPIARVDSKVSAMR